MSWHTNVPIRWQRELAIAQNALDCVESGVDQDGLAFILGRLELCSTHGSVYETAHIRIVYPPKFPARNQPPSVFLESHHDLWENVEDSHIEGDWKLCLFVPGESKIRFTDEDSLEKLLVVVHSFLIKERIFQKRLKQSRSNGSLVSWPGPERSHGIAGLREAVKSMGKIRRNAPCPCGSGLKFKKCHINRL